MSGLVKGIKKTFKKLSGSKVVKGLVIAAAVYYLSGMASGSMGDTAQSWSAGDAIDAGSDVPLDPGGASWSAGDAIDADVPMDTPFDAPASDVTAGISAPQVQTPQPQPAAPAQAPQAAPPGLVEQPGVQPPSSTPDWGLKAQGSAGVGTGKAGDASGSQGAWFKGLSPGAQAIIAGAMTGGAGAAMQALASKSAQEDARAREDRAREDRARRGTPAAYGAGAFTPRGIINGSMG